MLNIDGDLLAVHRTPEAREGQIVVARIDDEVTVKRLHRTIVTSATYRQSSHVPPALAGDEDAEPRGDGPELRLPDARGKLDALDPLWAQAIGNPMAYDYGVMRENYLYHYLTDW